MSKIVNVRKVANGSLQAEMIGVVAKAGRVNVLAALNKGDDRFNVGNERRAWFPVTLTSLLEMGVSSSILKSIEALEQGGKVEFTFESPKIDGEELCIQVSETTLPDTYQRANIMKAAKLITITPEVASNKNMPTQYDLSKYQGQKGYFLTNEGDHIFSRATVTVKSQLKHTFLESELVPETELASFGATLAEPVNVEKFENA